MDAQARMEHYILDKILKDTIEALRGSGIGDRDVFLIVKDRPGAGGASRFRSAGMEGGEEMKGGMDGQSG